MDDTPTRRQKRRITLGWKEWVDLPDLGSCSLIAKVDTGAKTSALHAFYIDEFDRNQETWIRFGLHPDRNSEANAVHCEARVKERRDVTDSGGHVENRYVIETRLNLGDDSYRTEVTLTNRDNMQYRVLLGRNSLRKRFLVDPARAYRTGKRTPS